MGIRKDRNEPEWDLKLSYKFNTSDDTELKKKFGEAEFKMSYIMMKDPITGEAKNED